MVGELVNGRYKLCDSLLGSLGSGCGDKQCDTRRERVGTDENRGDWSQNELTEWTLGFFLSKEWYKQSNELLYIKVQNQKRSLGQGKTLLCGRSGAR